MWSHWCLNIKESKAIRKLVQTQNIRHTLYCLGNFNECLIVAWFIPVIVIFSHLLWLCRHNLGMKSLFKSRIWRGNLPTFCMSQKLCLLTVLIRKHYNGNLNSLKSTGCLAVRTNLNINLNIYLSWYLFETLNNCFFLVYCKGFPWPLCHFL